MELKHFNHDHPLNFEDVQKNEGTDVMCNGCKKPILDHAYCCKEYDYFLHKRRAEVSQEINDPTHPEHLLTLEATSSSYTCDACKQGWDQFIYYCNKCEFGICMPCFLEDRIVKLAIHQHPLAFLLRPSLFFCDICSMEDKGTSYPCHSCQFWIHKSCASLPITIKNNDHHHPLTLTKQYLYNITNFILQCNKCDKYLWPPSSVYCCGPRRYFVHVKCATSESSR